MDSWSAWAKNLPRARSSGAGRPSSSSASTPFLPALTGAEPLARLLLFGHLEHLVLAEPDAGTRPRCYAQQSDSRLADLSDDALPGVRTAGVVVDDHQVRPQMQGVSALPGLQCRAHRGRAGRRKRRPRATLALHVQLSAEGLFQLLRRGEDQAPPSASIEQFVVQVVRQPHHPRPHLGVARHHHQLHVARIVEHRQRAQHRTHQRPDTIQVLADEAESGRRPQVQHLGDIANLALLQDEIAQRLAGDGLEFLVGGDVGPRHRQHRVGGVLHAGAQPHLQEVHIAAAAFPHPRTADDRPQPARIGVHRRAAIRAAHTPRSGSRRG